MDSSPRRRSVLLSLRKARAHIGAAGIPEGEQSARLRVRNLMGNTGNAVSAAFPARAQGQEGCGGDPCCPWVCTCAEHRAPSPSGAGSLGAEGSSRCCRRLHRPTRGARRQQRWLLHPQGWCKPFLGLMAPEVTCSRCQQ